MSARRKVLQADERTAIADETVRPARQPVREHLIAPVARPVAVQHDSPLRRIAVLVAERRERDPHLEYPAVLRDLRGRVPEVVGRVVLAGRIVRSGVVLDAARVREKQNRSAAIVARVEDDAGVIVGVATDVVAVVVRRTDVFRIVEHLERGIEKAAVVCEIPDALDLRLTVVADIRLVPLVETDRVLPPRVRQVAVDRDRPFGASDVDRAIDFLPEGLRREEQRRKQCANFQHLRRYVARLCQVATMLSERS
jgi:hypothetical protein